MAGDEGAREEYEGVRMVGYAVRFMLVSMAIGADVPFPDEEGRRDRGRKR